MKVLNEAEVMDRFGLDQTTIDAMEAEAADGVFHGEPRGGVVMGRPPVYGEAMVSVGFRESRRRVDAIDERAEQLGYASRSTYLRKLVDDDLRLAGIA